MEINIRTELNEIVISFLKDKVDVIFWREREDAIFQIVILKGYHFFEERELYNKIREFYTKIGEDYNVETQFYVFENDTLELQGCIY